MKTAPGHNDLGRGRENPLRNWFTESDLAWVWRYMSDRMWWQRQREQVAGMHHPECSKCSTHRIFQEIVWGLGRAFSFDLGRGRIGMVPEECGLSTLQPLRKLAFQADKHSVQGQRNDIED